MPAGQDAIFQCIYTYGSTQDASNFLIKIDYSKPGNMTTTETCSMYLLLSTTYNYTSDNCTMPPVKKAVIESNSISTVVEYTLRIPKVTADLSGSIVSCSVVEYYNHRLQWRTSAHLTVIDSVITEVSTSGSKFAPIVVVLVILPVSIVFIVYLVRKCRQGRVHQNGRKCSQYIDSQFLMRICLCFVSFRYTRLCAPQSTQRDTEPDGALYVQVGRKTICIQKGHNFTYV